MQPSSTHFQTHIPTTITQTLQPVQTIPIQPQIIVLNPSTSSNPSTTHTIPPTTIPLSTLNTPTNINSATSISEPIKPFDGLDHNYTPEEYLQHIEARVTFSLGLQPPTAHEYKFWHARRMAFIQYLSGNLFSEVLVPTPVAPHVRIPEYFTFDQSRTPTPSFADYPIRVDRITIYDPQNDPRFPISYSCRTIHYHK